VTCSGQNPEDKEFRFLSDNIVLGVLFPSFSQNAYHYFDHFFEYVAKVILQSRFENVPCSFQEEDPSGDAVT
jgi:hypothetical protein